MSNELEKVEKNTQVDGFDGFSSETEGADEVQHTGGVIRGALLKFGNDFTWATRDGEEMPPERELVASDIARIVQRWVDEKPVETIVLSPGQKFPDLAKLNAEAPQEEWTEKFGKMTGPWQAQNIVYLLDPNTMDRFTWATGSVGGGIAVRELAERVKWMRKLHGEHVYPVVTLSRVHMNTQFGGRERPHLEIKRWMSIGPSGSLSAPPAKELPTSAEIGDEISF